MCTSESGQKCGTQTLQLQQQSSGPQEVGKELHIKSALANALERRPGTGGWQSGGRRPATARQRSPAESLVMSLLLLMARGHTCNSTAGGTGARGSVTLSSSSSSSSPQQHTPPWPCATRPAAPLAVAAPAAAAGSPWRRRRSRRPPSAPAQTRPPPSPRPRSF